MAPQTLHSIEHRQRAVTVARVTCQNKFYQTPEASEPAGESLNKSSNPCQTLLWLASMPILYVFIELYWHCCRVAWPPLRTYGHWWHCYSGWPACAIVARSARPTSTLIQCRLAKSCAWWWTGWLFSAPRHSLCSHNCTCVVLRCRFLLSACFVSRCGNQAGRWQWHCHMASIDPQGAHSATAALLAIYSMDDNYCCSNHQQQKKIRQSIYSGPPVSQEQQFTQYADMASWRK